MKHNINSHSHCTVQQQGKFCSVCSARHEVVQEDRPKTILQTQNSVESISIIAVLPSRLFPLPRYYRDVCPRYRRYRGKIYSVVPVTAVLPRITAVLPLSPLPCSSLVSCMHVVGHIQLDEVVDLDKQLFSVIDTVAYHFFQKQ